MYRRTITQLFKNTILRKYSKHTTFEKKTVLPTPHCRIEEMQSLGYKRTHYIMVGF